MQKEGINEVSFQDLQKLTAELRLRGFSEKTVETYQKHVEDFLKSFNQKAEVANEDDIKIHFSQLLSKGTAPRTLALKKAALKFFYNEIIKKDVVKLKTPKIPKNVFEVLSKEEIKKLIEHAGSSKTKLITKFLYSTGLRVSELVNLKIKDIDLQEKTGWVRRGKGSKDRFFPISDQLTTELIYYLKKQTVNQEYLFTGRNGKLTSRAVQKYLKETAKRAGIEKIVTPHKLRHSYATHLLDSGVDIIHIQELLGHSSLNTTQIYTHVSKEHLRRIKNPLDLL